IWQRTIASQMAAARFENTRLDIEAGQYLLRANGRRVLFDGFLRAYFESTDEPEKEIAPLPEVQPGEELKLLGLDASQHFTQPPPRFTEASLVKTLEEFGIGRPSTYAPTISTLVDRKCGRPVVVKLGQSGRFYPCTDFKKGKKGEQMPDGGCDYSEPLEGQKEPQLEILEGDRCPQCDKPLARRRGRFGPFVGCTGYPDCK